MIRILCFLLAALPAALAAQTSGRLSPESLWKLGRVSLEDVSPDGKQALYGVTAYDLAENKGNRDLYLVPVEGGQPRKLTAFKGNEFNARFRPDGRRIGFLSNETGVIQIWEMNPDGSDMKRLSLLDGNILGFEYSPRGDKLLFVQEVRIAPTTQSLYPDLPKAQGRILDALMYRHWNEWEDGAFSHLFLADYQDGSLGTPRDLMPGEAFDTPLKPFGGMEQIAFSPDGSRIAYTCKKLSGTAYAVSTNSDIYLYDLDSEKTENLSEGMSGYDMEPVFSPDGKTLAWNSMERPGFEADRNRIFLLDLATRSKRELSAGLDQSCNHPAWSADGKYIYFLTGVRATHHLASLEVASGRYAQLTSGDYDYSAFAPAAKGFVAARMSISEPSELFFVSEKGEARPLTATNDYLLRQVKMGKVEKRMVRASDGQEILTWVIYPPDFDPAKQYPALLYCQGGPQSTVSQFFSYRWNFQLMAAQGYVVVAPNRRGLPSFGQRWNDQISGDWGGQAMEDLLAAIDDVAKEPYIDKNRLGAVGASFGGYSVYWLAGNHQKRFKAFISHCGIYNLESWYGSTEEVFFGNFDMEGAYWELKPNPSYKLHSPHLYARNWDTPMLVIHSEQDFRVPIGEGIQAFQAAQLQGIPSRFLYFPNEGHWINQPQNSILWQRVFFEWLDQWLK